MMAGYVWSGTIGLVEGVARTFRVRATGSRPKIVVGAGGRGVVSHAGARLLADLAEVTGLRQGSSEALSLLRQRQSGHDPGRFAVDVAVMLADRGEVITDLGGLRYQPGLFGSVRVLALGQFRW